MADAHVMAGGAPPSSEEQSLEGEKAWLKQQNAALLHQLAQLQHQHQQLTQAAAAAAAHAAGAGAGQPAAAGYPQAAGAQGAQQANSMSMQQQPQASEQPATGGPPGAQPPPAKMAHNPAWSEQINPENGQTYYWNSQTGESTYTRPPDYNPSKAGAATIKGPPGANLFVVRKMRKGEYDAFNDEDLRREFSKYGTVTRAEMTTDKETGWSKGFGFVSFSTVEAADAALQNIHGSWMDGREMKVEKTKEDFTTGYSSGYL